MRCIALLALIGSFNVIASETVELRFKPSFVTGNAHVRLGDVVDISGGTADCIQSLKTVDLGAPPSAGRNVELTRFEIESWIASQEPKLECPTKWTGLTRVSVRTSAKALDFDRLLADAANALRSDISQRYLDVSVVPAAAQGRTPEVAEGTKTQFVLPDTSRLSTRVVVIAELRDPAGHLRTLPLWFDISATGPVWVTSHSLKPGSVLSANDVHRAIVDIARLGAAVIPEKATLDALVVQRPLPEGAAIRTVDVVKRRDIEAGNPVAVQARSGAVAVQTAGIALQASDIGDKLFVRLPRSQEVIQAKAIRRDVVEVIE